MIYSRSENRTLCGDSGAGRECYTQKSRHNDLMSALKKACLAFGVALLVSAACMGSAQAATTTVYITDGMDDAYHNNFGTFSNSDSYVYVYRGVPNHSSGGFRFNSISIPKGATINSATFYVYSQSAGNDLYCRVYGEAADSSSNYSDQPDVLSRPRTTNYTSSSVIDADGLNIGLGYKGFPVTAVVQEIVNRSGWYSGNSLSILMIGDTSGTSQIRLLCL